MAAGEAARVIDEKPAVRWAGLELLQARRSAGVAGPEADRQPLQVTITLIGVGPLDRPPEALVTLEDFGGLCPGDRADDRQQKDRRHALARPRRHHAACQPDDRNAREEEKEGLEHGCLAKERDAARQREVDQTDRYARSYDQAIHTV